MKVLIISMTVGEGHNQIAKAVKNSLEKMGAETKIIQLYGYSDREIARQNKIFLNACKLVPAVYNQIWLHTCKKPIKSYINGVIRDCKDYILKQIEAYRPDAVVCTHNNAGAVVSHLVETGKIDGNIKTYSIVFDYCVCPYWEYNTGLNYAVLPDDNMTDEMVLKGFKKEQLLPLGLPVDEKYTLTLDKRECREKLGLETDKFTVVLYSGGNCASSAYSIIKKLMKCKTQIQIVSICGKNKKEFAKVNKLIRKYNLYNVINFGFCTCLEMVYSAGDVVISRGGGMGVTEQINKHIPFVSREKLILNEKINKFYFERIGLGVPMRKLSDAPEIVDRLANDPVKLQDMSDKAREFSKPNATTDLAKHIMGSN